jgi:Protein of unknown function (DUF2971)
LQLYKYRSWSISTHKLWLLENEIFFGSPKNLNDPYDCKIYPDVGTIKSQEDKNLYGQILLKDSPKEWDRNKLENIIDKIKLSVQNDPNVLQSVLNENTEKRMDLHLGICSLSEDCYNTTMWAHYAENNSGICIGYNSYELLKAKYNHPKALIKVTYAIDYPRISLLSSPWETMQKIVGTKLKNWEYEKEHRLFSIFIKEDTTDDERKMHLPKGVINEIIMGLKISSEHEDEVTKYARLNAIPLFKIYKNNNSFEYSRVKVD